MAIPTTAEVGVILGRILVLRIGLTPAVLGAPDILALGSDLATTVLVSVTEAATSAVTMAVITKKTTRPPMIGDLVTVWFLRTCGVFAAQTFEFLETLDELARVHSPR